MRKHVLVGMVFLVLCAVALGQQQSAPDESQDQDQTPTQSQPTSKANEKGEQQKAHDRNAEAGESSSRETRIDTTAPKDDVKNHPNSGVAIDEAGGAGGSSAPADVQEMHPWNPYRAVKDDEVGDFYFKRGGYKAAIARYEDALQYKENDAVANFRLGQCYEKVDQPDQAIAHYKEYLRILPEGPEAKHARKAIEKLEASEKQKTAAK